MDSLSIAEESVAILIIHSILQYGPDDIKYRYSCLIIGVQNHIDKLLEDHFVDEFIVRLNRHLDDCEQNWQHELVLLVLLQ